jgi:Papain-like cysteine protease AvrRpt2
MEASVFLASQSFAQSTVISIPFKMQHQEQDEWCWAANAVSAARYLGGKALSQCALVNDELGRKSCCSDGGSEDCNQPYYLEDALTAAGCHFRRVGRAISAAAIGSALSMGTAIEARIGWTNGRGKFDGSGHFVAITAIEPVTSMLHVADPWYRTSSIGYDDFARAYKTVGVWTDTYLIDRLAGAERGPAPSPAEPSDLYAYLSAASSTMKGQHVAPLLTLSLNRAALPNPLQGVEQTGMQGIDALQMSGPDAGVREPRTLQIPSLLVTALVAKIGDAVICKPIDRVPSFLEANRLYSQAEFEAIIQKQAQRKLALLAKLERS